MDKMITTVLTAFGTVAAIGVLLMMAASSILPELSDTFGSRR
ncbi:hypothetical protein GCM10010470_59400 [Saccharopolyspora taberi]|uniref:Uncharacterized protein n=1 Tax=Saccharopolyspora taberi TaxID=60895 RepID=A0ABN3VM37_9PSEU